MMKPLSLLGLLAVSAALSGCETTGNPREGGIFWSETKAKERLRARREHQDAVYDDTDRVERSNDRLESAAARRRRMLEQ
jgi:hypothetical protein